MVDRGFAAVEGFERFIAALNEPPMTAMAPPGELAEAALHISAVLQPGLDPGRTHAALGAFVGRCERPTRDAVVEALIGSGLLRGDHDTYGDWRNCCLDHVLAKGTGIPITLSIVVIEVARRLGVPLVGVGMPAHFLVGDERDGEWFLDPFNAQVLDRPGCRELLAALTGGRVRWSDSYLAPTPTIDIVTRMLNNLKAVFDRRRDRVRLALVMRMRAAVPGVETEAGETARAMAVFN